MAGEGRGLPPSLWRAFFHPWVWRMAWRDSRSQRLRLVVFSLSMVAGVAALTAIHSLKTSVERGIALEAKSLLGSDLRVSSRREIEGDDLERLAGRAKRMSREVSFPTMMRFLPDGGARMMQVRGMSGEFPFYGEVETQPQEAWDRLLEEGGVLLEPAVLDQFSAAVGDEVELGGIRLRILGVVEKPAPRGNRFSGFAPEVYVRLSDLEGSGLLGGSSMASYEVHLEMAGGVEGESLKEEIQEEFPGQQWRLETPEDRQESLGKVLERFQQFLGLIALASLVLGAIGVAGAVHAHVSRRIGTIAVLRCLGCPGHVAFAIYLGQAMALGLMGALMGGGLGVAMQVGLLMVLGSELPVSVNPSPEWKVAGQTMGLGFAVCCGFALLPLMKIRGISPAATLRSAGGLRGGFWWSLPVYVGLAGVLVAVGYANDGSLLRSLALVGGMLVSFLVVVAVARGLMAVTRRVVSFRWPYLLRQGVSNLHRPGNQTLLFLLSMGLGTFLLVTILSARNLMNERLSVEQLEGSPDLYLIDVQRDQVAGVRKVLEDRDLPVLESVPMVTMRIASIRGVPVGELEEVPKWVGRREFRSTYRGDLNATEVVVAGRLATEAVGLGGVVPVSLEEKIAGDLKVDLGDEIVMDVQGVPVRAEVTSIRRVDWSQFNLNFFMVFAPGALEDAPGFYVVTTRTGTAEVSGELQRELAAGYANVTAIDLTLILETVRGILGRISMVVTVLAGFTFLAGFPILMGTLLNGREVRLRESVLLRTLGASGRQVRAIFLVEYTALGLLSALTGVLLGVSANAVLAVTVFDSSPWPDWTLVGMALGLVTAVSVLGGLFLSRGVSSHPPLLILRGSDAL